MKEQSLARLLQKGWAEDFRWKVLIRPRLEGLTNDEYFWEPAPGTLTVRPDGAGAFELDPVEGTDPPLGNIAWRMAHLASSLSSHPVAAAAFGADWPAPELAAPAGSAAEGLERLDRAYEHWTRAVAAVPDADLTRALGPAAGPFQEHPVVGIILHIQFEMLQRGADLCLLRDLYWHLHQGA